MIRARASRSWSLVLPAATVAAVALAAVVLFTDPGREAGGAAVEDVAAAPSEYDGRELTLYGTVIEGPEALPPGAGGAFVMTGPDGGRLLVVPANPQDTRGLTEERPVEVRGIARAPEPAADERRPEQPPLTRTDLLGATGTRAVIEDASVSVE